MKQKQVINLHLPANWNQCTTAELEIIARSLLLRTSQAGRYHPFEWHQVKVDAVLGINRLQVLSVDMGEHTAAPATKYLEKSYTVKMAPKRTIFNITEGQLLDLCHRLDWLTDPQAKPMTLFPYPVLKLGWLHEYHGPAPMMDGYTWQEYRMLQDWMQAYMNAENRRLQLINHPRANLNTLRQLAQQADEARACFLAVLFRARRALVNPQRAAKPFRQFNPVKWQVVLFWWGSLMRLLQARFPRVFKQQPVKSKKQKTSQNPWDFYNQMVASLADEYKTSEADQAAETYSVTLQKLDNMAAKSAELESIRKKK